MTNGLSLKELNEKEKDKSFFSQLNEFRRMYKENRDKNIAEKKYFKIKNRNAKLKYHIMKIRKMEDCDIVSVVHFDNQGDSYLIPAIRKDNKIFYEAEKEHIKNIRDITNINYYDVETDKGYLCHSLIPHTMKIKENCGLQETIVKEAETLDFDKKLFEKEFAVKSIMNMSKKQLTALKWIGFFCFLGGMGIGVVVTSWILVRFV